MFLFLWEYPSCYSFSISYVLDCKLSLLFYIFFSLEAFENTGLEYKIFYSIYFVRWVHHRNTYQESQEDKSKRRFDQLCLKHFGFVYSSKRLSLWLKPRDHPSCSCEIINVQTVHENTIKECLSVCDWNSNISVVFSAAITGLTVNKWV